MLQTHGLLAGKAATCYPAERFTGTLEKYTKDAAVVVDGNAITSQVHTYARRRLTIIRT